MLLSLLLIFVLGYIGYRLFCFFHIPGGAVTGSLVMLAIVTSLGVEWAEMPSLMTIFFQVIVGVVIGSKFSKEKVSTLKSILIPAILSSAWMIGICLIVGLLLAKWTGIELGSALYGSVPGGIFEMGLIALSFNLSVPIVTLFQFVRVISINIGVPLLVIKYNHSQKKKEEYQSAEGITKSENSNNKANLLDILFLLLLGGVGGYSATYVGLPVGGMLGSMLMIGTSRVIGIPLKELPPWLIFVTQIILGGYLGTTFTPEMVFILKTLLFPTLIFSIFVVGNGIFVGVLFNRFLGWDLATSLLATAAGGATLMTLTALEINADAIKVSLLQSIRLVVILLIMPTLIAHIIG